MFDSEPALDLNTYAQQHGMTALETEILKAYLDLDPSVRENLLQHFKQRLTRPAAPESVQQDDDDIEADVEDYRRRRLSEKKQVDVSSLSSEDTAKMA